MKNHKDTIPTLSRKEIIIGTLMVGAVVCAVIFATYEMYDSYKKWPIEENFTYLKKERIYNVSNDTRISGRFFIGSGYINERESYFVFSKDSSGGYLRKGFPVAETIVYEDTTELSSFTPYVEYPIGLLVKLDRITKDTISKEEFDLTNSLWSSNDKTKLHVPKGTVVQEYKID